MKYALIKNDTVIEYREYQTAPECRIVDGLPVLRPVVELPKPDFEPDLQRVDETVQIFDNRVEVGWTVVALPAEQIEANLDRALMQHLHARAAERRYDSIHTATLRAGYPGPFQAQGVAYATWMDSCNAAAYQIMAEVKAGQRAIPTAAELLAEMPELVLPA